MKRFTLLCLFFCFTFPVFAQTGKTVSSSFDRDLDTAVYFEQLGNLFRQCADKALPAVVNIRVTQNRPLGQGRSNRSPRTVIEESGSGFVATIAQKTVIITNRHVIGDAEKSAIEIFTHDRRILTPIKIVTNEDFDLAVLEVAETMSQSVAIGNSSEVHIGDIVLAAGNPFGLNQSLSMGIISAVGRRNVPGTNGAAPRVGFFQTDAAVNPGSSGGVLLNLRGEVIGILTAIATQGGGNEGVAFVMPINAVMPIAEQLVQTGTVLKPHMGFGFEAVFSAEERRKLGIDRRIGAKIKTIAPNSPAEQSGLIASDVIVKFNDTVVEDDLHVTHLVAQSTISKPVTLQINRNGKSLEITITPVAQLSR